jgi:uncharacterized membrane protein
MVADAPQYYVIQKFSVLLFLGWCYQKSFEQLNEIFFLLRGPYLQPMCNVLSPIFTAVFIVLRHLYIAYHSGISFPA